MSAAHVLIVEDDGWLAEQYQRVLEKAGYETIVALNAPVAINAVDDQKPDVILLDILLTGSTAFALMNELQSYTDTGDIPIILCTNLAADLSIDKLKPYGVKKILDKATMSVDDIVVAVRSVTL